MSRKVEWTTEEILKLIDEYKQQEILWDPNNGNYYNSFIKNDAWEHIRINIGRTISETKKKMDSLLTSFRRERQKCKSRSGDGLDDVYDSSWFAFKPMIFLLDKFTPTRTVDCEFSKNVSQTNESHNQRVDQFIETIDVEEKEELPVAQNTNKVSKHTTKKSHFTSPKMRNEMRKRKVKDDRINAAYNVLRSTVDYKTPRDDSSVFGEHVGNKHRKYSNQTRNIVEHLINGILFNADIGTYDSNSYPNYSPGPASFVPQYSPHTSTSSMVFPSHSPEPSPPSILFCSLKSDSEYTD